MGPIEIPDWLPSADLSPNARVHHQARARAVRQAKGQVWLALRAQADAEGWTPQAKHGPRRRLTVTLCRPRLLDDDNALASCKPIFDSVRAEGYLVDDSPRYADLRVAQRKVTRRMGRTAFGGTRVSTVLCLEELDGTHP